MLVTSNKVMEWIFFLPTDEILCIRQNICRALVATFNFFIIVSIAAVNLAYFLKFLYTTLEEALYTISFIIGYTTLTYMAMTAFLARDKIVKMFKHLSEIYDFCKFHCIFKCLVFYFYQKNI